MSITPQPIGPATRKVLAMIDNSELDARYPDHTHFIDAQNPHQALMTSRALFSGDPVVVVYQDGREVLFTPKPSHGLAAALLLLALLWIKVRERPSTDEALMGFPPPEDGRVPMRRGVPGPRGGGVFLSRVQQTRLLDAAAAVVVDEGVKRLSATRVSARAGMSSKTFYDLFADGEECFLGVFDRAVHELAAAVGPASAVEDEWVRRVRSALVALLACLERDPDLAKVVFVEALGAGSLVLKRRAEVLDRVAMFVDEGREGGLAPAGLPSLVAPGVVGAAFSIVHARLVEQSAGSLMELVGPVMATVVLPYRGREASAAELARPVPELPVLPEPGEPVEDDAGEEVSPVAPSIDSVRTTERTLMVLASVGEHGGANNRVVAAGAGIHDDSQISRLLARLEGLGLVRNEGTGRVGSAKAWWLTASGAEFLRTGRRLAGAEPAAGSARSAGRGKSAGAGRSGRGRRRGAGRGAIGGGAVVGMETIEYQRVRILRGAAAVVEEHGYGAVTVAHITARAKVSRSTFYELFVDREQCLLAVMQDIEAQITKELRAADLGDLPWRERVRIGLWTVLRFFDREPVLARFCVVESARGDDRMASYRAELLERVAGVFAEGGEQGLLPAGRVERAESAKVSPLTAEGIAGAVVSILNTRLSTAGGRAARRPSKDVQPVVSCSDLHGELMGLIVLPLLGPEAAQLERDRPEPAEPAPAALAVPEPDGDRGGRRLELGSERPRVPGLRMTYRTALVLEGIAQRPGLSNLDVARYAQVNDQGQISKLLARLERHGLVLNTGGGQGQGSPNEWLLTPAGQNVEQSIREHQKQAA